MANVKLKKVIAIRCTSRITTHADFLRLTPDNKVELSRNGKIHAEQQLSPENFQTLIDIFRNPEPLTGDGDQRGIGGVSVTSRVPLNGTARYFIHLHGCRWGVAIPQDVKEQVWL